MDPQAPTSPGHAPRRPRTGSRSFSLHSDKSGSREGPTTPSVHERHEKERRDSFLRGESKANPNAAMLEAEPSTRNAAEKVTLNSVRNTPAKDTHGNVIAEPDLSNPTRPRWERPLDTIRSFEKAIDGDYSRRSHARGHSEYDVQASRRSSYYGGHGGSRYQQGNHYDRRPDSYYDNYGNAPAPPRQRFARGISEGGMGRGYNNGYGGPASPPQANMHPGSGGNAYEGSSGSEGTGPWANSTDPSSQNSSYERLAQGMGKNGQSQDQTYMAERVGGQYAIDEEGDSYGYPPRPPPKSGFNPSPPAPGPPMHSSPRQPIKLGGGNDTVAQQQFASQGGQLPSTARPQAQSEKRQSWISRRFSKSK